MEKTGLVLEGGGMRGAYTAGALAWLTDNHVTFDYGVGISSGAAYLTSFWQGDKKVPHNMSVNYAADPENVGIKAFRKEGYYVAYKHIFDDDLIGKEHMTVHKLKEEHAPIEVGAYDLDQGKTIYFGSEYLDDNLTVLRAAASLPVASAIVEFDGKKLLDGGIIDMIPIQRAVDNGVTRNLIITTKPADYVRKPASKFVIFLMKIVYKQWPSIVANYKVRHLNYYKQMDLINDLTAKGQALNIRPSRDIKMSRFKGSPENCAKLYQLGYDDMEANKDAILKFLDKGE
ncbi:MAG: patatin family protein [Bulleidia sp.]|nr:patatin family protein [Bulleidia sp.]